MFDTDSRLIACEELRRSLWFGYRCVASEKNFLTLRIEERNDDKLAKSSNDYAAKFAIRLRRETMSGTSFTGPKKYLPPPPEGQRGLEQDAKFDLRLTMDAIPAIVWSHWPNGSGDFFNKSWVAYTSLSPEESKGLGWSKALHPDDLPAYVGSWKEAIGTGRPFEQEARFRRADGQYRWFLARGFPLRDEAGKVIKWYGQLTDIEDRKLAEARARQAETELRLAMDSIPALAWSAGPDGSADFVNRGWIEYTGVSLEETKGSGWSSRIHPDDRTKFVDKYLKAVEAGAPYEDEGRIRRADGQYRWFLVRGTPLRDQTGKIIKWYGICTDIEDRRRAEDALRDSEQRFRDFSDASADWYWETGPDHRFTYIPVGRPELARVADHDRVQVGRTRWEIAADVEEQPNKWRDHIAVLNEHRPFRNFIYPVPRQDGSTIYVSVSGVPRFDGDGRFLGYRGGGSDVTASVRADQIEKSLRQARAELAHVTRLTTLGELTASIAHEVNQPLTGVIGNGAACLRWLSKDPPQFYGEVRASIEAMISDADRASTIIAKIRALAKNTLPQMGVLDLNDVVKEAVALVQRELDDHSVLLRQDLAPDALIMGDRTQLQQVMINLIMNGVEAMAAISERARRMVIRSGRQESNQIVVEVQDSGIGFNPAKTDRLFDAFFSTKSNGLGMGLSISRSIIAAHDGQLTISSDGETGATVRITLPPHHGAR
jgi:PAS domain S-box-containing protein